MKLSSIRVAAALLLATAAHAADAKAPVTPAQTPAADAKPATAPALTPEQDQLVKLANFYDRATLAFTREGNALDAQSAQVIRAAVVEKLKQSQPQPAAAKR